MTSVLTIGEIQSAKTFINRIYRKCNMTTKTTKNVQTDRYATQTSCFWQPLHQHLTCHLVHVHYLQLSAHHQ